jgi:hypothetical protein
MGLSARGRTKGKSSWINYSASSKGLHGSVSAKLSKNITANISKNGVRGTINFGNGIRYTTSTSKTSRKTQRTRSYNSYESSDEFGPIVSFLIDAFIWTVLFVCLLVLLFIGGGLLSIFL